MTQTVNQKDTVQKTNRLFYSSSMLLLLPHNTTQHTPYSISNTMAMTLQDTYSCTNREVDESDDNNDAREDVSYSGDDVHCAVLLGLVGQSRGLPDLIIISLNSFLYVLRPGNSEPLHKQPHNSMGVGTMTIP